MDKYYLLLRRFLRAGFALLAREHWDPRAIDEFNQILIDLPLKVENATTPLGVTLHVCSIYLDELVAVVLSPSPATTTTSSTTSTSLSKGREETTTTIPLVRLLQPYLRALAVSPTKATYDRVYEEAFRPLVDALLVDGDDDRRGGSRRRRRGDGGGRGGSNKRRKTAEEGGDTLEEEENNSEGDDAGADADERTPLDQLLNRVALDGGIDQGRPTRQQVRTSIFQAFFDMGATGPETTEANRRRLYAVWRLGSEDDDDVVES
jgi:ribosomal RNA-processing protein 1